MSGEATQVKEVSARYLAKAEVQPGYKRTEVGVIPENWEVMPLGDLFSFKNGLNKAKRFFGFGTPIVNYMDVYDSPGLRSMDLSGRVSLSTEELKNFEVQRGDVFFTRTSETVEEIGTAAVLLDESPDTVFSGFVLRARPRDNRLLNTYKQFCFTSATVRRQITSTSTYTTRALTNGRYLSAVHIAVPPFAEQRAIAEALSDVDGSLGALEALIAKKRAIKKAAMQQLLTGKTRLPGFSGSGKRNVWVRLRTLIPRTCRVTQSRTSPSTISRLSKSMPDGCLVSPRRYSAQPHRGHAESFAIAMCSCPRCDRILWRTSFIASRCRTPSVRLASPYFEQRDAVLSLDSCLPIYSVML